MVYYLKGWSDICIYLLVWPYNWYTCSLTAAINTHLMYFYADYVFLQTVSHLFQRLEDELWELIQRQSDEMDYVISGSSRRVHPTIYYSCRK